jgi:hypothetical protein
LRAVNAQTYAKCWRRMQQPDFKPGKPGLIAAASVFRAEFASNHPGKGRFAPAGAIWRVRGDDARLQNAAANAI